MRPMGNPAWMEGDRSSLDALAAHEIPLYIVKELVAVDVAMVVRGRYGLWVIIIKPRDE